MRCKGIGGILVGLSVFWGSSVWAQTTERGVIESPSAFVSGIGFISGWKCNAENITLKIWCNNLALPHKPVSMDVPRPDTEDICDGPDTNNGWIAQVNWNDYRNCTRVEAFDDGHMFASRDFTVGTISDEFIRDHDGTSIRVADFPVMGQVSRFVWSTATQHWEAMHSFPCREEDNCGDPTTDSGNTDSGNADGGSIPEIVVNEGFTAGTQPLPQYQGNLDFPLPNPIRAISYSVIFEPGDWMFLQNSSKGTATLLVPHDEIEAKSSRITLLALKGVAPLVEAYHSRWVVNLIGVGIEQLYRLVGSSSDPNYFGSGDGPVIYTKSNDPQLFPQIPPAGISAEQYNRYWRKNPQIWPQTPPDMTLPIPQGTYKELHNTKIIHFLNGETGEFGYRLYVERDRQLTDQESQDLFYPNNNRGPWRKIKSYWGPTPGTAIRTGGSLITYFPPTETVIYRENFRPGLLANGPGDRRFARDDLRGTGKLEIIYMSNELYDYWVNPPDPDDTYFVDSPVEYSSAATE